MWVHVSCYTTTWRTTTMTNVKMALLDLLRKDERKCCQLRTTGVASTASIRIRSPSTTTRS